MVVRASDFIWSGREGSGRDLHLCVGKGDVLCMLCGSYRGEFTEESFKEMVKVGASFYGLVAAFEKDDHVPCPNCQARLFDYELTNGKLRKVCQVCGVAGPFSTNERNADRSWGRVFEKGEGNDG